MDKLFYVHFSDYDNMGERNGVLWPCEIIRLINIMVHSNQPSKDKLIESCQEIFNKSTLGEIHYIQNVDTITLIHVTMKNKK